MAHDIFILIPAKTDPSLTHAEFFSKQFHGILKTGLGVYTDGKAIRIHPKRRIFPSLGRGLGGGVVHNLDFEKAIMQPPSGIDRIKPV